MRLPQDLYEQLIAHAVREAPDECCGIIAGRGGDAEKAYALENTAHSPFRYEIDPREQFRVMMEIDDADLELMAIYHSHTRSDPYPSQTDINLAFYPDALYVIIGTAAAEEPLVKAYEIRDGRVSEAVLTIA